MINKAKQYLLQYQSECVDAFNMEVSAEDIKNNPEAKKLARTINRQGKLIDKAIKILDKIG